ncbi:MAG TPA: hypothetical protein VJ890_13000 [Vineibacter sp.]|nr:hypothetical protein [Vineibacter sp.]
MGTLPEGQYQFQENNMKRLAVVAAIAAGIAMPAAAMTEAECDALWRKADANSDGTLNDAEAARYLAALRVHNRTIPADGRITAATFKQACLADDFKTTAVDPQAPLKGANSFTEGQAKDRAVAAGFASVSELKKDEDGIWRGTATLDGKSTSVAVDYKGNVVAQTP